MASSSEGVATLFAYGFHFLLALSISFLPMRVYGNPSWFNKSFIQILLVCTLSILRSANPTFIRNQQTGRGYLSHHFSIPPTKHTKVTKMYAPVLVRVTAHRLHPTPANKTATPRAVTRAHMMVFARRRGPPDPPARTTAALNLNPTSYLLPPPPSLQVILIVTGSFTPRSSPTRTREPAHLR